MLARPRGGRVRTYGASYGTVSVLPPMRPVQQRVTIEGQVTQRPMAGAIDLGSRNAGPSRPGPASAEAGGVPPGAPASA
jgi:hypothetical protein